MKSIETDEELKIIQEFESGEFESLKGNELLEMQGVVKSATNNTIKKLSTKKSISIRVDYVTMMHEISFK